MVNCPNCGTEIEEGKKFCRHCGTPIQSARDVSDIEEAETIHLYPNPTGEADTNVPTSPIQSGNTAAQLPPTAPAYVPPPVNYYTPPQPPAVYQPPADVRSNIRLGDWLGGGWQVYKENWLLMSLASLLAIFLGAVTAGILAGPLLLGLYGMAFKTMRGERPVISDLFNWQGRFLQAFLAFLISAAIYFGFAAGGRSELLIVLSFLVVNPILTVALGFVMPLILERDMDIAAAINTVGRLMFSRDKLMWWVVGLVFFFINLGGASLCGIGFLVTLPWTISAAAVAYNQIFGIDDPNRTLH